MTAEDHTLPERPEGFARAIIADVLTGSRAVLAVAVMLAIASSRFDWAAVFVTFAWITDFFDGRLARSTVHPTRLGDWDLRIDITLGIGILIGLGWSGWVPWTAVLVPMLVLGTLAIAMHNPSPTMLLLAYIYLVFFWVLIAERPLGGWLPFAALPLIATLDWGRFTRVILPVFFKGIAALARGERTPDTKPVLDEWV
ncbi:MAG: CDP-alcohol phosphatidyltransferase family protein [Acidimicrobiia bacterium]|nr:CDP-alcohol phosphatidyltransferase family protein [Acidimicrobiia bacterium]MBT8214586.1 CDP-alcohol phosphatidyltransferase family protein [Acidimicrobiia bacterium]NNC90863.1 CDP-alcohol phosphatidyltransferase family protein [Acidimicrobiia bacterium]